MATVRAMWDALEVDSQIDPVTYLRPSLKDLSIALLGRLDAGTATAEELEMLAGLPKCEMPPETILRTYVEQFWTTVWGQSTSDRVRVTGGRESGQIGTSAR